MRCVGMILGVFLLAAGIRATVWWQVRDDPEFKKLLSDSARYDDWARKTVAGDWLSRGEGVFYQTPLYPYFLAAQYAIFGPGNIAAVRVTQIALGSAAAMLLALAARRLSGDWAGLMAGTLWALQPAAVFFDLQIDKASIDGFLICAMLWLIAMMIERPRWWQMIVTGALLGLLSLSRENALALIVVVLPLAWHAGRRVQRFPVRIEQWLFPLMLAAATLLVLLPVAIRNRVVGGEWHLTTCQFGPNFYIGNNRGADGVYRPLRAGRGGPEFERTDAIELAEARAHRHLSPREVSRFWTLRALDAMWETPGRAVRLIIRKWLMVWNHAEIADSGDIDRLWASSSLLAALLAVLHAGVLVPLAAAGAALAWDSRRKWGWVAAMALVMSLAVCLFYLFARYRFPILPMLALLSAVGLCEIRRARSWKAALITIAAAGVAAMVANAETILPERIRGADHYNRALACEQLGRPATAEREYHRALAANPSLVAAYNNLGLLLNERGAYDDAIQVLKRGIEVQTDDAFLWNNLGMALGGKGQFDAAAACFGKALAIAPDFELARANLVKARQATQPAR